MAAAELDIAEKPVHHPLLNGKVNDSFFLPVINAGELCLFGFLLHDLHLVDNLGRNVLRCQLWVIQEEGLSVNGNLRNGLSVCSDASVRADLHTRELLQKVLQHVIVRRLERRSRIFDSILLNDDGIARCSYACSLENLSVRVHLHDAQIHGILNRDLSSVILVSQKFSLDRVASRSHLVKYGLSLVIGQGIFACGIRAGFCQ